MHPPGELAAGPVALRRWQAGWSTCLLAAVQASLPQLRAYMTWAKDDYSIDSADEFLHQATRTWVEGTEFSYAMWTPNGEMVGVGSLMTRMGPGVLEIGYWVHTAYTGRGLATAATVALAQAALSMDQIHRVAIRHDAGNLASARVAERAGFTEVRRCASTLDRARDATGVEVVWERPCR